MNTSEVVSASQPEEANGPEKLQETSELDRLINEIGVARFAGRISGGFIAELPGYQAIERFIRADVKRPFLSKLSQALLHRPNSYEDE